MLNHTRMPCSEHAHALSPASQSHRAVCRVRMRRGESDGVSDPTAPRYDPACGSSQSWSDAPQAGEWFHAQFIYLTEHASPPLSKAPVYARELRPSTPPPPPVPPRPPPEPKPPPRPSPPPAPRPSLSDQEWFAMQLRVEAQHSSQRPPTPSQWHHPTSASGSAQPRVPSWGSTPHASKPSESTPCKGVISPASAASLIIIALLLWCSYSGNGRQEAARRGAWEVPCAADDACDDQADRTQQWQGGAQVLGHGTRQRPAEPEDAWDSDEQSSHVVLSEITRKPRLQRSSTPGSDGESTDSIPVESSVPKVWQTSWVKRDRQPEVQRKCLGRAEPSRSMDSESFNGRTCAPATSRGAMLGSVQGAALD